MQVNHTFDTLSVALDDLIRAAGDGDIDQDATVAVMVALEETVPTLMLSEVRVLHEKLERAMAVVQNRRDELADKLGEIKHSRRALSSYDHIRTFDKEQRLYRRA